MFSSTLSKPQFSSKGLIPSVPKLNNPVLLLIYIQLFLKNLTFE